MICTCCTKYLCRHRQRAPLLDLFHTLDIVCTVRTLHSCHDPYKVLRFIHTQYPYKCDSSIPKNVIHPCNILVQAPPRGAPPPRPPVAARGHHSGPSSGHSGTPGGFTEDGQGGPAARGRKLGELKLKIPRGGVKVKALRLPALCLSICLLSLSLSLSLSLTHSLSLSLSLSLSAPVSLSLSLSLCSSLSMSRVRALSDQCIV